MADQDHVEQEMGFLAHLFELRDRLLRIVLVLGIVFLLLMPFAQGLYDLLSDPLVKHLPNGQTLISVGVVSSVFIPYKLALMVAFVLSLPYVLYQVWGFVAPGLYQHEKKLITPLLVSSVALFYLGMAFAYFLVFPMMFSILPGFAPTNVAVTPDIAEYLDFVIMMFMAFGIGFEMPVATLLVISTGMASREDLVKARPYVVVVAFIIGMFMTPPDVLSQIMLAVPMWLLFEVGLIASGVFGKHIDRIRQARERAEAESDEHATAAQATTAASTRGGEDVESWGDDRYTYEETGPVQSTQDNGYRPMSEAEMEAELERLDAEQVRQAALDEQGRLAAGASAGVSSDAPKS